MTVSAAGKGLDAALVRWPVAVLWRGVLFLCEKSREADFHPSLWTFCTLFLVAEIRLFLRNLGARTYLWDLREEIGRREDIKLEGAAKLFVVTIVY